MPVFKLIPIPAGLADAAWSSSPVRSECWVNAADEAEARSMASARYQDASATVPGHAPPKSPWLDAALVAASLDETGEMRVPYGTVLGTGAHM